MVNYNFIFCQGLFKVNKTSLVLLVSKTLVCVLGYRHNHRAVMEITRFISDKIPQRSKTLMNFAKRTLQYYLRECCNEHAA